MSILANYDRAAAAATAIINNIEPQQYTLGTPCEKWTVRDVVNHLTAGNMRVAAMLRGDEPPERDADFLGDDPPGAFALSLAGTKAAMMEPGALERTVTTPLGERAGAFAVQMRINELLVHAWDLAKATGQPTDIDPELAEEALTQWRERLRDLPRTEGGPFGPEQHAPAAAPAADRLAAFLGRAQH